MSIFQKFDPSKKSHVEWLRDLVSDDLDMKAKGDLLAKNPMKVDVPPFDTAQIMFGLCAAYTKAVFKKNALVLTE